MKGYNYLLLFCILQSSIAIGQIGIGTKLPDESSILDINSTTKGLLIPRMNTTERDRIILPSNGLLVFNTISQKMEINIGTKLNPNWITIGNTYESGVIATDLASGAINIGNILGVANPVIMSGEATINNVGFIRMNNTAVISKTLTGYAATSGIINNSDTLLQAIEKLDGNQQTKVYTSVNDDYTVLASDYTLLCDARLKSFTLSLPNAASCAGKIYIISKIDESYNELNFSPAIRLSTTNTITKLNYLKFFKIQSDGQVWHIIN
jgi:hypothetical protein